MEFKPNGVLMVSGGAIAQIAPSGLEGTYKLENGKVQISAMGETRDGTFDGTKLVIDGAEAAKVQ